MRPLCARWILIALALVWTVPTARAQSTMAQTKRLFNEAKVHYYRGEYKLAEAKFKAVLSIDDQAVSANAFLGMVYFATKQCDLAVPNLRRYLKMRPSGRYSKQAKDLLRKCGVSPDAGNMAASVAQLVLRVSQDGAQIKVDGDMRGVSPSEPIPVQPGPHVVQVYLSGYLPWSKKVDVSGGQVVPLDVDLVRDRRVDMAGSKGQGNKGREKPKPPGTLVLKGLLPRTTVAVDDIRMEPDDDGSLRLSPGTRKVRVTGYGLQSWRGTVTIRSNETTSVMVALEPTQQTNSVRRWAWVAMGTSAALAVGGVVVGALENRLYERIENYDRRSGSRSDLESLEERRNTLALVSNILYGFSAAALGTGALLFTITPEVESVGQGQTRALLKGRVTF